MNFGERIYELRNKASLSQGELADRLGVSRQAVSKWENNSAVPELDKLLNMSELFGISLDELVKGDSPVKEAVTVAVPDVASGIIKQSLPTRKIAGLVFFGMAFLTALVLFVMGGFGGLLYALPFVMFGLICWFCEKYTGLKCLWAALFMTNAFCGWATGISVSAVRYTFSWTYKMNYWILAASWALVLFNAFVVIYTAVKLGKEAPKHPGKAKKTLILSVVSVFTLKVIDYIIGGISAYLFENIFANGEYMHAFSFVLNIIGVFEQYIFEIVLTFAIISVIRYIKLKKA